MNEKEPDGGTRRLSRVSPTLKRDYPDVMMSLNGVVSVDWTECPLVEVNPRKVSGAPILKGTRVQADSIVENFESGSPVEEIAENFAVSESSIRTVLAFAAERQKLFRA